MEIYCYSEAMLNHVPEISLNNFQNELLYSNKAIILKDSTTDRRECAINNDRSEDNLGDRIIRFHDLIGTSNVYRIPLRYLVDLGLINFPIKFDTKFNFNLEKYLTKLFDR